MRRPARDIVPSGTWCADQHRRFSRYLSCRRQNNRILRRRACMRPSVVFTAAKTITAKLLRLFGCQWTLHIRHQSDPKQLQLRQHGLLLVSRAADGRTPNWTGYRHDRPRSFRCISTRRAANLHANELKLMTSLVRVHCILYPFHCHNHAVTSACTIIQHCNELPFHDTRCRENRIFDWYIMSQNMTIIYCHYAVLFGSVMLLWFRVDQNWLLKWDKIF